MGDQIPSSNAYLLSSSLREVDRKPERDGPQPFLRRRQRHRDLSALVNASAATAAPHPEAHPDADQLRTYAPPTFCFAPHVLEPEFKIKPPSFNYLTPKTGISTAIEPEVDVKVERERLREIEAPCQIVRPRLRRRPATLFHGAATTTTKRVWSVPAVSSFLRKTTSRRALGLHTRTKSGVLRSITANMNQVSHSMAYQEPQSQYDVEDEDEDMGEDGERHLDFSITDDEEGEHVGDVGEEPLDETDAKATFNPIALGLKEINGLAHFRVSSHKPGNGVEELMSDDIDRYWQSDGIQPHRLTIYFVKRVEIRALRFYVDHNQDESYTPIKIHWLAGTSLHDLHNFGECLLQKPAGWIEVPLTGAGGGEDGNSLMAHVVQAQIIENHQNGKDTHIRGLKIFGFDDQLRAAGATGVDVCARGADDGERAVFRVDESKDPEENELAFMEHVRGVERERKFLVGDPSGTASTLDFMEDPVIR